MKPLSKARNSQMQESRQQMAMSTLQNAKANQQRRSYSVAPGLLSLVLCMSVLLLGACRKSPQEVNPVATEGNLTIQLNCLGVDLRAG